MPPHPHSVLPHEQSKPTPILIKTTEVGPRNRATPHSSHNQRDLLVINHIIIFLSLKPSDGFLHKTNSYRFLGVSRPFSFGHQLTSSGSSESVIHQAAILNFAQVPQEPRVLRTLFPLGTLNCMLLQAPFSAYSEQSLCKTNSDFLPLD